ncbi:hypothetical protein [Lentzea sp. NBRC 105346]|uniref:hypothetical protein n=1 Tax=Lentzea sp. NBRC 105346 TaxID=3032205 RepID=UPI00255512D3|nr:hypothetical protein [Lentzea sp. NBRC 105346]
MRWAGRIVDRSARRAGRLARWGNLPSERLAHHVDLPGCTTSQLHQTRRLRSPPVHPPPCTSCQSAHVRMVS